MEDTRTPLEIVNAENTYMRPGTLVRFEHNTDNDLEGVYEVATRVIGAHGMYVTLVDVPDSTYSSSVLVLV